MALKVVAVNGFDLKQPCGDPCNLQPGDEFTLAVVLEKAPEEGYTTVQSAVDYGSNLIYKGNLMPNEEIVWSSCSLPLMVQVGARLIHACVSGLIPPLPSSDFEGTVVKTPLTCSANASSTEVVLVSSNTNGSEIVTPLADHIFPDMEHVTINCGNPPMSTPTETLTPSDTPTGTITPPTDTPTGTPSPVATATSPATATNTATATLQPTATRTPTHTATPGPPTSTPTPPPTNTPAALLGDVSCDYVVDPTDTLFMLQFQAALIDALPCPDVGDVDEDGATTLIDGALILQYSAGIITSLPPGHLNQP